MGHTEADDGEVNLTGAGSKTRPGYVRQGFWEYF